MGDDKRESMTYENAVTMSNFRSAVLESSLPVLLDFWAPWCKPCIGTTAFVEELALAYKDRLAVAIINGDEEPDLANSYGVSSFPALVVIKNGQEYCKRFGALPKHEIEKLFKDLL